MPRTTKSEKAGLKFPVSRIRAMFLAHEVSQRVSDSSAVYMAAVFEYLTAEIIELSMKAAHDDGRTRIQPNDLNVGLKRDKDLARHFKMAVVPKSKFITSGVPAGINENNRHAGDRRSKSNASSQRGSAGPSTGRKSAVRKTGKTQSSTKKVGKKM